MNSDLYKFFYTISWNLIQGDRVLKLVKIESQEANSTSFDDYTK